ncbi:hypothetical protein KG089_06875 [Carnobacteriaceae bacterium zg-ZUI252]|nr:hypothetical protein [Carnobacteriaceae bacterium zg-ZUI252]MBS4769761.1 hypothetical protein [Carnobacteriaceae bacterium zg-ZUI240]QTU83170.1 hypothetical protein J7S27_01195 [Carnobacteriaceae bacterium zg-C25]
MYLTIEQTAEFLEIEINEVVRLVRERQIRFHIVDDEVLINQSQFTLFLKYREKALKEYQDYLDTPIPIDIDIKDED